VTQSVDSSVAIAAILADHAAHDHAEDALRASAKTIAHVATETYSVLTRLPPPLRLDGAAAARIVGARLPSTHVVLDAAAHAMAPSRLAAARVSGSATYDGLIALTALEHDLELLSLDHRAARTYRALGVRFRLLAP
jgi:predicted nucleic acid-binding protein